LAADLLGGALRDRSVLLGNRLRTWRNSTHLWARRAALLAQLKYRDATDTALLAQTILHLAGERDFFIRKAIGWALRAYATTDPRWGEVFVREREARLSSLGRREALKRT